MLICQQPDICGHHHVQSGSEADALLLFNVLFAFLVPVLIVGLHAKWLLVCESQLNVR